MVPQELELMRKTKGTDATLQWRKEKKNKNAGDQKVIKAWIWYIGSYHVYLHHPAGAAAIPKAGMCSAEAPGSPLEWHK